MNARIQLIAVLLLAFQRCGNSLDTGPFSGINYAKNKNASQEPVTLNGYTAALAVDGNNNTDLYGNSCTHTDYRNYLPASWTVDLGLPLYVTGIIIYNRKDWRIRLQSFKIYGLTKLEKEIIYDDSGKNLYKNEVIYIEILASKAYTSIQIWIPANSQILTYLTLCEVEVYGVPGCEPPTLETYVRVSSFPTNYTIGTNITLTCASGYTPLNNTTITCNNNSEWSGVQPTCSRCPAPEILENGYYVVANETECELNNQIEFNYLCKIEAHCNEGYSLQNNSERICRENGQWTKANALCATDVCNFPGEILHGKYIYNSNITYLFGSLNYGTKIEVQCETGYERKGSLERICTSNGSWSNDDTYCSIVHCNIQDLGNLPNGYYVVNEKNESVSSFATYMQTASAVCTKGFRLVSKSTATCNSDGTWSTHTTSCTIVTCLAPKETTDLKYKIWHNTSFGSFVNSFPFGAIAEVICENGVIKAGSIVRHCTLDGLWDGKDPVCVPLCSSPAATNGILRDVNNTHLDMYEEGQTLSLTCFEGYTSNTGQKNLTCQRNHSWNSLPICEKIPVNISSTNSNMVMTGGLIGGLVLSAIAAIVVAGAFLVYFLRVKRKMRQEADIYTRLHTQQASNVENEYAKIQETTVTSTF